VVVFLSVEYAARDWTRVERRAALNMEANDGIGLPGSGNYGCGSHTAQNSAAYIG
jgi:hypothetical protein